MPTGPCWTRASPDFVRKGPSKQGINHSQIALEWLDFESQRRGVKILHAGNGPEVRIGASGVAVDGFAPSSCTAFFFDGCFWHSCELCQGDPSPTKRAKLESFFDTTAEDIRRYDDMVKDYVAGYCQEVVTMRECEWNALKSVPDTPQYEYVAKMKSNTRADTSEGPTSEHDLIQEIREGRIFGAALVDITTPDELRERFSDLPPIFKHADIGLEDLSDYMKNLCLESGANTNKRRSLISSYHAREILIITPLLRWYMEHGLVVTKLYMTLEWEPRRCFQDLTQSMAECRRQSDRDLDQKIMGDAFKLLANAVYGKCIQNKLQATNVKLCRGKTVQKVINSSRYRGHKRLQTDGETAQSLSSGRRAVDREMSHIQLSQDCNAQTGTPDYEAQEEALILEADAIYEMATTPTSVKEDLPIHIGLYVYQYAKLHMLAFRYEFLEVYFEKRKWQQLYMDTDSVYLQLSVDRLEEACIPGRRRAYFENHDKWLPSECCQQHKSLYVETMVEKEAMASVIRDRGGQATAAMAWMPRMECCQRQHDYDQRTPGLFKVEFEGRAMVCLCSKTYFCMSDEWSEPKHSCKGIQKSLNSLTFDHYLRALRRRGVDTDVQTNRGFRVHPKTGGIETYVQQRRGLTNLYFKRKVRADGVTTDPLDIWHNTTSGWSGPSGSSLQAPRDAGKALWCREWPWEERKWCPDVPTWLSSTMLMNKKLLTRWGRHTRNSVICFNIRDMHK